MVLLLSLVSLSLVLSRQVFLTRPVKPVNLAPNELVPSSPLVVTSEGQAVHRILTVEANSWGGLCVPARLLRDGVTYTTTIYPLMSQATHSVPLIVFARTDRGWRVILSTNIWRRPKKVPLPRRTAIKPGDNYLCWSLFARRASASFRFEIVRLPASRTWLERSS